MTQQKMMTHVRAQLALDLNCDPGDFAREGFVFCEAMDNPGRRPFPRGEQHFEMLYMGGATIVSASADLLPYLRQQIAGKTRDEAFSMPFVMGHGLYYLPDNARIIPQPTPPDYTAELVEQADIPTLYQLEGFHNALGYDIAHPRPDVLAVLARHNGQVVGMAGASADCDMLWQIGIDVLPGHRGNGLAVALVTQLGAEILRRGKVPYYGTSSANIPSQRVAHRSGFAPAWVCVFRGRFSGGMSMPTG